MLMPRRLGGSFGATNGLFRVLFCRAGGEHHCGAHWTANDSHRLRHVLGERARHEALCATGVLDALPPAGH